jgi:hypothetical protein
MEKMPNPGLMGSLGCLTPRPSQLKAFDRTSSTPLPTKWTDPVGPLMAPRNSPPERLVHPQYVALDQYELIDKRGLGIPLRQVVTHRDPSGLRLRAKSRACIPSTPHGPPPIAAHKRYRHRLLLNPRRQPPPRRLPEGETASPLGPSSQEGLRDPLLQMLRPAHVPPFLLQSQSIHPAGHPSRLSPFPFRTRHPGRSDRTAWLTAGPWTACRSST